MTPPPNTETLQARLEIAEAKRDGYKAVATDLIAAIATFKQLEPPQWAATVFGAYNAALAELEELA